MDLSSGAIQPIKRDRKNIHMGNYTVFNIKMKVKNDVGN